VLLSCWLALLPSKDAEAATAAGAAVVGTDELVAEIQGGNLNFERCVATPDVMPLVSKVARVSE
jgi:large subunit ribosomal protein L1